MAGDMCGLTITDYIPLGLSWLLLLGEGGAMEVGSNLHDTRAAAFSALPAPNGPRCALRKRTIVCLQVQRAPSMGANFLANRASDVLRT